MNMKIKLIIGGILLLAIFIMLFFSNNMKNFITEKLFQQLPNYSCSNGGLCMKKYLRLKNIP